MSLADLLRVKREKSGLTQENIAEITGVSTVSVSGWENGKRPKDKNIPKIAEAYGITEKELSHELIKDILKEKKQYISQQNSFPSFLLPNEDFPYVRNLMFNKEETNLIRAICVVYDNMQYPDWSLGDQFIYDPTILSLICKQDSSNITYINQIAYGIWLKLNEDNKREPQIEIIRFITRYLMEDPDGISTDIFNVFDLSTENLIQFVKIIFHGINRTCEYSIAWIPEFKKLVQIIQLIEQHKLNCARFIEDNRLTYNQALKPERWLLGGKITKEWIFYYEPGMEYSRTENNETQIQLTTKGKALALYIKQNKTLLADILKREQSC